MGIAYQNIIQESTANPFTMAWNRRFSGTCQTGQGPCVKHSAYGKSMPSKALDEFSLTPQAFRIWINIPGDIQIKILNNVWCRTCSDTTGIGSVSGKVEKGMLILKGICTRCGNPVARVIENE